jgi:hypothetical protein
VLPLRGPAISSVLEEGAARSEDRVTLSFDRVLTSVIELGHELSPVIGSVSDIDTGLFEFKFDYLNINLIVLN